MSALSPVYVLKRAGEAITDLQFWNHDSDTMLVAAYSGKAGVDVWDLKRRRIAFNLPSTNPMLSAHAFPSGDIATLDKEGNLKLIDTNSGTPVYKSQLVIPNVAFCKAAVWGKNVSRYIVAVPGEDKSTVNVWDLSKEMIIAQLIPSSESQLGMPWCIKLIGKDRLIALVGYEDGSILCWDVFESKLLSKPLSLYSDPIMCFDAFEEEDHSIFGVTGSVTECLIKWKCAYSESSGINSDKLSKISDFSILQQHEIINKGLSCVKIRNDHKILVTGGWDYNIRIFSWKSFKQLAILDYHTGTVQSIAFSNDKLFACGSTDKKISVWNIYSDK